MRQVILDGRDGPCDHEILRDKLAGHLHARLAEYEEDGICPALAGPGDVLARFDGLTGRQAADRLAQLGVYALPEGDSVRFRIGPRVTFEDLDYVQAAAAELL
jgi:hypothetical protein